MVQRITPEKMEEVWERIGSVLGELVGLDSNGDPLIQVILVNKQRNHSLMYAPIPKDAPGREADILSRLSLNLSIATEHFNQYTKKRLEELEVGE